MIRIILALVLLVFPLNVWSASITSKVVGTIGTPALASVATNWVGDVAPVDGDTIVIASGAVIAQDVARIYGSKVSPVGHAVTTEGISSSDYGTFIPMTGIPLTLRGYDTTNNTLMLNSRYSKFLPQQGAIFNIDLASDYQSIIKADGIIAADNVTFTIPAANLNWNNAGTTAYTAVGIPPFDTDNHNIKAFKLWSDTDQDSGKISNAAGTAIGTSSDTSVVITPTAPASSFTNRVASYAALAANGDYYVDHNKGVVHWYYTGTGTLTVSVAYKYLTWFGWGILQNESNTTYKSLSITNSNLYYMGASTPASHSESSGMAIKGYYQTSVIDDATKGFYLSGNTFDTCARPVVLYEAHGTTTNKVMITGNTIRNCRDIKINNFQAHMLLGYSDYVSIDHNTLDTYGLLIAGLRRDIKNIYVEYNTGRVVFDSGLPIVADTSFVRYNTIQGWNGFTDSGGFQVEGISGGVNTYTNNTMSNDNRCARIGNFMVIQNNKFTGYFHHGFVAKRDSGYVGGSVITGNIIAKGYAPGDMSGGWTLGYANTYWIDNTTIANNTFDTGERSINFNDQEGDVVLGTRLRIYNNNLTNNNQGIYRPAPDAANFSKMAIERLDYNNDYNNTGIVSNVKQATFIKSAAEYNSNTRNATGVYLHSPTYTLPQATGRSLVQVNSGTAGTNKSITLAWGGGTAQELVIDQGTATSGETDRIADSSKSWEYNIHKGKYVIIVSGTGAGQVGLISTSYVSTLLIIANNSTNLWAVAPSTDSVYMIIEPEVTLLDSGAALGVNAGLYLPDATLTTGTLTDSDITITTNALSVDPQYNASYAPANQLLKTSGYGGTYIGALDVIAPVVKKPGSSFGNFNFSFQ